MNGTVWASSVEPSKAEGTGPLQWNRLYKADTIRILLSVPVFYSGVICSGTTTTDGVVNAGVLYSGCRCLAGCLNSLHKLYYIAPIYTVYFRLSPYKANLQQAE